MGDDQGAGQVRQVGGQGRAAPEGTQPRTGRQAAGRSDDVDAGSATTGAAVQAVSSSPRPPPTSTTWVRPCCSASAHERPGEDGARRGAVGGRGEVPGRTPAAGRTMRAIQRVLPRVPPRRLAPRASTVRRRGSARAVACTRDPQRRASGAAATSASSAPAGSAPSSVPPCSGPATASSPSPASARPPGRAPRTCCPAYPCAREEVVAGPSWCCWPSRTTRSPRWSPGSPHRRLAGRAAGRAHLRPPRARASSTRLAAAHPGPGPAPGDDLHRDRGGPRPAGRLLLRGDRARAAAPGRRGAGRWRWAASRSGSTEEARPLYHAALAHGANHLVTLVAQAMQAAARGRAWREPRRVLGPLLSRGAGQRAARGRRAR